MTQHQIHVTESNRIESLCQTFKVLAFSKGKNPFSKRVVLVPSSAFKSYLKMDLASDEEIGVAFGMTLLSYEEGLVHLAELLLDERERKKVPKLLELTLLLQGEMLQLLKGEESGGKAIDPLWNYLGLKDRTNIGAKEEKKLYFLSKNLSRLFLNYSRFAKPEKGQDLKEADLNFEALLFDKIFGEDSRYTTRIDKLLKPLKDDRGPPDLEIYVFAPFMTLGEVDFLKKIASKVCVEVFTLTPTSVLFDDMYSDKEEIREQKRRALKRTEVPFEKNSLLANYSLVFRETQKNILDTVDSITGIYLTESGSAKEPEWAELLRPEHLLIGDGTDLTLLQGLQTDILLMRIPKERISINETKSSIHLHEAPSPLREIEILYNELEKMMVEEDGRASSLLPSDIQVFAKDIKKYEPFINAVFGSGQSIFKYQITGEKAAPHPLVAAYLHLLEIPGSRFEASSIVSLLEYDSFRKRWGLNKSDVQTIRDISGHSSFTWGLSQDHKIEYYKSKGFQKWDYDTSSGTKDDFEKYIYTKLIGLDKDGYEEDGARIEIKDANLIALWLSLLTSLREDLFSLAGNTKKTVGQWMEVLESLLEKYFETEGDQDLESAKQFIRAKFKETESFGPSLLNTECHFETLRHYLKDALEGSLQGDREEDLRSVRFSSLLPHHAMPGKVIALIGLEENVFPQRDPQDSLDLLKKEKGSQYIPKISDIDRYLFMEAMLSAREKLYLSYSATSLDGEECSPSTAVLDLMQYLDSAFDLSGSKVSPQVACKHPKHRFDPFYFEGEHPFKSISLNHFKEYAASKGLKIVRRPPSFDEGKVSIDAKGEAISLNDLSSFLKNPLKAYLRKTHQLSLPKHKEGSKEHALDIPKNVKRELEKISLKKGTAPSLLVEKGLGALTAPPLFKNVHLQKIEDDLFDTIETLEEIGLSPSAFHSLNLLPYGDIHAMEDGEMTHLPELITKEGYRLHGTIEKLSAKGMVRISKYFEREALSALPGLAALQLAAVPDEKKVPSRLLFIGKKKGIIKLQDPDDYLHKLITLYLEGMKKPLLLFPDFLKPLSEKNLEKLKSEIANAFDPYLENETSSILQWSFGSKEDIDPEKMIEELSETAAFLYRPLKEMEPLKNLPEE